MGVVGHFREFTQLLEGLDGGVGRVIDVSLASTEAEHREDLKASVVVDLNPMDGLGSNVTTPDGSPLVINSDGSQLRLHLDIIQTSEETIVQVGETPDKSLNEEVAEIQRGIGDENSELQTDGLGHLSEPDRGTNSHSDADANRDSASDEGTDKTATMVHPSAVKTTDRVTSVATDPKTDSESDEQRSEEKDSTSDDLPAHRDPACLSEVYDPDATFEEMTEALDASVTPQTVRKNMIRHGIHQPQSYATTTSETGSLGESDGISSEESENETDPSESKSHVESTDHELVSEAPEATEPTIESEPSESQSGKSDIVDEGMGEATDEDADLTENAVKVDSEGRTDESGQSTEASVNDASHSGSESDESSETTSVAELPELPEEYEHFDVTITEICEAVQNSKTLYEVERALGLETVVVRGLLQELDLLGFVTGRMATKRDHSTSWTDIRNRVVDAATG